MTTWKEFCKKYKEEHKVSYKECLKLCSPLWKEYKMKRDNPQPEPKPPKKRKPKKVRKREKKRKTLIAIEENKKPFK